MFHWISSYFTHSSQGLESGDSALLNQRTPSTAKPSSFSQFTAEERSAVIDVKPFLRADILYTALDPAANEAIRQHVFNQQESLPPWPNVPVKSLWGDQTAWTVIFSQRELERWLQQLRGDKSERWVRAYETNIVSGGNHFVSVFQLAEI